jgi:hypothetical protein
MWVRRARLSGTYLAMHQRKKALTAAFPLVRVLSVLVGDTGFEPVTLSSWRFRQRRPAQRRHGGCRPDQRLGLQRMLGHAGHFMIIFGYLRST